MEASRPATWDGPDGIVKFDYRLLYIPNLEVAIRSTDQSKKYDTYDLNTMISWLKAEQMEWGISHLVLRTAEQFADDLITTCT